jgi:carbonic anhydrase/acetyltransferase-like protein (isoleucine patch superfamily)
VIVAHGARVNGPSLLGADGPSQEHSSDKHSSDKHTASFVGFNSLIDGAVLDHNAMVLHLARVGPGITIPQGHVVLSGKNVETQAEAEDFDLGKVIPITDGLTPSPSWGRHPRPCK